MGLLDDVAKSTIKLMVQEPFYGHFFLNILKREDERDDATIGLGLGGPGARSIILSIGRRYWHDVIDDEELRYGAIKHQVLHLLFKHILNAHRFGNAKLFNIAADLVVNQYLLAEQRGACAVTLSDFPSLQLEPHQDVGYYYRALDQLRNAGDGASSGARADLEHLSTLLEHEQTMPDDDHSGWRSFREMNDGERAIFDGELNRLVCASADRTHRTTGRLPGGVLDRIGAIRALVEPQIPWKRVLRLFATSSRRTSIRNTIRRPSKRYGTTPGIKVVRHHKLLVAVDTSGSVSKEELATFFAEIYRIHKQGAEVRVAECDVEIHRSYTYTGSTPEAVAGRGGTSFEAPIKYANEVFLPDALIYFTDGHAPAPKTKCRKPVLWVISSQGLSETSADYAALPGQKVKMKMRMNQSGRA